MRYEIRSLGEWIGPRTPASKRRSSAVFRASWESTLDLLCFEVGQLGGQLIVVQVDADPSDIRRDGMLRTRARVGFDGVRVSFDSRHGPMTYATDVYEQAYTDAMTGWQANVRAIALSLEALRAVDRYGVSRTGEQYRGWTAIEAGPSAGMSADAAARLLARHASSGGISYNPTTVQCDRATAEAAFRAAARRTHPDHGGNAEEFARVTAAREILAASTGGPS